jgi:hypothetical protein
MHPRKNYFYRGLGIFAAGWLAFAGEPQAAGLVLNGSGDLVAATGVDIGGTLYDVTFQDGTCVALFSGCNGSGDFAFNDLTAAQAAAQALLDQVFRDLIIGLFDSHPERTGGCENTISCTAFVPYAGDGAFVTFAGAANTASEPSDGVVSNVMTASNDPTTVDNTVYAVFTRAVATDADPVPEPDMIGLTILGLGALLARRRRR